MKKTIKGLILKIGLPLILIIILNLLFLSESIAEWFTVNISRYINIALGAVFSIFGSFSIAEWLFILAVVSAIAVVIIIIVFLFKAKFRKKAGKMALNLVSAVLFIVLTVNLTITSGYSRKPIDAPLNLKIEKLTEEKAKFAAEYFRDELVLVNDKISRDENGDIGAIDFKKLNELLNLEYKKQLDNNYFTDYNFSAKKIVLSPLLTYFSISGMYSPFTGEANISNIRPNYQLPVIMAHELAHSRGVLREDEAEFLAYYICINSESDYLRYCGLMYASNRMINTVYQTNDKAALEIRNSYPEEINVEIKNRNALYEKYDNEFLSNVGDFFNNLWLKSNKVSDGTVSYSKTAQRLYALYLMKS